VRCLFLSFWRNVLLPFSSFPAREKNVLGSLDRFYNLDISERVVGRHSQLANYLRLFVTIFPIFPLFFVSANEGVWDLLLYKGSLYSKRFEEKSAF
jgi:hypothetical protein